jgi:Uncharacterised nucleotidyltransferase
MICWKVIPKSGQAELQSNFLANVQNSFFLTAELLKLLALFETHSISAVPFKGPILAASVYGNLSLRQFGDLDIFVHKEDIARAARLLVSQGYRSSGEDRIAWNSRMTTRMWLISGLNTMCLYIQTAGLE